MTVNDESTESTSTTPPEATAAPAEAAPAPLPTLPPGIRVLLGCVSPETAFVQKDYPYGWNLRCERRVWVETKKRYGQRPVFQTTDPKKAWVHWNNPKAGQYYEIVVLTVDEREGSETKGNVDHHVLGMHCDEAKIDAFIAKYGEALTGEYERGAIKTLRAIARANKRVTYTIVGAGEQGQTAKEAAAIFGGVIRSELRELNAQS